MSQQLKFQGEEESNLATREPAKPLKDAQMCGSFFLVFGTRILFLAFFIDDSLSSISDKNMAKIDWKIAKE
mgnify:CR=1 FL=1